MPLRASVSSSERWGNNSAYLTGLSLPSRLRGPAERGGRRAAAAAVSNLLLRIVSAPLPAAVSKRSRAKARLDPWPRLWFGRGPRPPIRAPHPGPRPHPPLTWASAARGCARSGCERGARRCSRGRRRPGRRCRAAAARGSWLPGRPGRGQGPAPRGREAASRLSCQRRAPPRPQARRDPAPPPPLGSAPAGSDPSQGAPSPPTTSPPPPPAPGARPRSSQCLLKLHPNPNNAPAQAPPRAYDLRQSQLRFWLRSSGSALSPPPQAPPSVRKLHPNKSSAQNALSLATLIPSHLPSWRRR